ncbi:MAG: IclR family transcriptional regulator [Treponema sp.]|nr:IclR family transcriptional regulator [Treponema sp.]
MKTTKKRTDYTPQTFRKALGLLEAFTMQNPELTAKELGYLSRMTTSSLYRYLAIMEEQGYLIKNLETNKYAIGFRLVELCGIAMCRMDFYRHGQPALDRISSELKMNANMGVLYQGDILHIAYSIWVASGHRPYYSVIGRRTPAHCTAMGKVLLSSLDLTEVHETISRYGWRKMTGFSIDNFKDLDRELQKIRQKGYAEDMRENSDTTCCLAMPILDKKGNVVAAISASTNYEHFTKEQKHIQDCVLKNAEEATYRMGYLGEYPVIKEKKNEPFPK